MIVSVAVAPMRVNPISITARSASSVRTPPAALTWMCGEVFARMRRRSSWVAPDGAKPVLVLTKSAPAAALLLVVGQVGVLEDHFDDRAGRMPDLHDGLDVRLHVGVPTGLERADLDHHVQLGGTVRQRSPRLEDLDLGGVIPVGEPDRAP